MTGLLIKDWKLLKNQGRFFIFVLLFGVLIMAVGSQSHSNFITSYMTFIFSIFVLSTLSYDSYDNGMAFLMSLPVSRKTYVKEKYVFGLMLTAGAWLVTVLARQAIVYLRFSPAEGRELLQMDMVYLLLVLIFVAYSLPVRIKYGAEKGQMISAGILGAICFGVFFLVGSQAGRERLTAFLPRVPVDSWLLWAGTGLFCAISWAVSFRISVRIMEKQEF